MCANQSSVDGGRIMYPFILRTLDGHSYKDITTPYGYGGPMYWGISEVVVDSRDFWASFDAWAHANKVVSEFVRFGLDSKRRLPYPGDVIMRTVNVVRSLDIAPEALWMDFAHKVRKNVKAALRHGVTVQVDQSGEGLEEFLRIYRETMSRRSAAGAYYFPDQFFHTIHQDLPGMFAYFHAFYEGKVVSTELLLLSDDTAYSFLGGTQDDAFGYRPNDLLKYEIMRWLARRGIENYVLGGGATPGDGIEKYKRGFAPHGVVDFVTGQRVLLPDAYGSLVEEQRAQFSRDGIVWPAQSPYFPAYRISA